MKLPYGRIGVSIEDATEPKIHLFKYYVCYLLGDNMKTPNTIVVCGMLVLLGLITSGCLGGNPQPTNNPPTAKIVIDNNGPFYVGDNFAFNGSFSTDDKGIAEYSWDFGDGSTGKGATILHAYSSDGNFTVILTVKDTDGATGSANVKVRVDKPLPPSKNIAIACTKITGTYTWKCIVANADTGVAFKTVTARILNDSGLVHGIWNAPITISAGGNISVSNPYSPIDPTTRLVDDGDGSFGVGDCFYLVSVQGNAIIGLELRLHGTDGSDGSARIM